MNENLEEQFKNVDIVSYTKELLDSGKITLEEVEKFARIQARQGVVGEEIITKMQNGLEETKNVVTADENGNPGMVVTNPSGEEYIVPAETFAKKYEIDPENPTVYKPKGGPMLSYQTSENLSFMAPWGEEMKIEAGGHIMVNPENFNDMYGIQGPEFDETYKPVQRKQDANNIDTSNLSPETIEELKKEGLLPTEEQENMENQISSGKRM